MGLQLIQQTESHFLSPERACRRVHIWRDAFVGRRATHRYENLHLTQRFGWGIAERASYSSFRGLFDVPASALSGRILRRIGVERSLMLGQVGTT